ncbi:MAG: GGDEF domain-containing protein, partial [Rubrivivax sp.]|nr:GGDEF domain-containing protein [Rubrivivax sp.]
MTGPDLRDAFELIDSIVIADFDAAGQPLGGNAGLRRLCGKHAVSLWQLLTQPAVAVLIDAAADDQGRVHTGLLTARGPQDSTVTLRGALYRTAVGLRLVAGYDMHEFEALSASLLSLNSEVNDAYRALALSKQVLQAREAEILKLSRTDALTGVGNRRMLDETLAREVERARRVGLALSLLILDIDHFKRVNDSWGHETGDRVLKETGATLLQMLRATDVATRMGGEEFVVVLPATTLAETLVCAERFRAALAAHDFGLPGPVTSSFGVAELQPAEAGNALLARAD